MIRKADPEASTPKPGWFQAGATGPESTYFGKDLYKEIILRNPTRTVL